MMDAGSRRSGHVDLNGLSDVHIRSRRDRSRPSTRSWAWYYIVSIPSPTAHGAPALFFTLGATPSDAIDRARRLDLLGHHRQHRSNDNLLFPTRDGDGCFLTDPFSCTIRFLSINKVVVDWPRGSSVGPIRYRTMSANLWNALDIATGSNDDYDEDEMVDFMGYEKIINTEEAYLVESSDQLLKVNRWILDSNPGETDRFTVYEADLLSSHPQVECSLRGCALFLGRYCSKSVLVGEALFFGPFRQRAARPSRLSSLCFADMWAHRQDSMASLSPGRSRLRLRFPSRKDSPAFISRGLSFLGSPTLNPSSPPLRRRFDLSSRVCFRRSKSVAKFLFPLSRALSCPCELAVVAEPPLAVLEIRPSPAKRRRAPPSPAVSAAASRSLCPEPLDLDPTVQIRADSSQT
ncbi:hypothetical protein HU200_035789 [Digitaria exilis]|uniref:Uncharacterized protein n=1 Tax=Digitaria exilis TaxID=1010633 RepID=A0A835BT64_9POAL|nr:hypothetical protein HU200_035789 [Digitaria exilis]